MWPPDAELLAAWRRLVADPDTAGAFAALVLRPLAADLARRNPAADPADLDTAAGDAVLSLLRDPGKYDPARSPLAAYLGLAARGDLLNLWARQRRAARGRVPLDSVELDPPARNEDGGGDLPGFDSPGLGAVIASLTDAERRVFDLMRAGERATAAFAHALGVADRPPAEQAAEVKRAKERVLKRLQRAGRGT